MKNVVFDGPAVKRSGIWPALALGFIFLGAPANSHAAVQWNDPEHSPEFTYFIETNLYDEASWAALADTEQKKALDSIRAKIMVRAGTMPRSKEVGSAAADRAKPKTPDETEQESSEKAVPESVNRLGSAVSDGTLDTFSGGSRFFDGLLQGSGGAPGVQSGVNNYSVPEPGPPARAKTDPAKGKYSSLKQVAPPEPGPKRIWKAGENLKKKMEEFVDGLKLKVGDKIDVVLNYHSTRMKTDCGEPMTIRKVGKDKYYIYYLDKNGKIGVYGNGWLHKTVTAKYLKQNFRETIRGFVEKYKKYVGDGSEMLSITIADFKDDLADYYRDLDDSHWPWVPGKKPK